MKLLKVFFFFSFYFLLSVRFLLISSLLSLFLIKNGFNFFMVGKLTSTAMVERNMYIFHSINFDLSLFAASSDQQLQRNITDSSIPQKSKNKNKLNMKWIF